MRQLKFGLAATAAIGACLLFVPASSQAAPINGNALQNGPTQAAQLTEVRYRGRHWRGNHWRGRNWNHHRNWGYYDNDVGGALAAGAIFGLAAGAIASNAYASGNTVAYCSQRFRSYDPASGTYLGYDGNRHPCP